MTPLQNLAICPDLLRTLAQQGVVFAEAVPAYLARLQQDPNQSVLSAEQLQQLYTVIEAIPLDAMHEAESAPMVFGVLDEQLKPVDGSAKIDLSDLLGGEYDN
ncbi:TPA: hypothetical protein ACGUP1_002181 [Vibrio vulnificus]|nr:hypothetical protein [Vibrio vulnificus]HDY7436659.1 hypothetical protein [Vibrio vulnificus]